MTAPALAFDTDNGRYYRHPGNSKTVPSITNIKSKKHVELKHWAARKCADYAADSREKLALLDRDEAYQLVKGALYRKDPNDPSFVGDTVHKWIEGWVKHEEHPERGEDWATAPLSARQMFKQFMRFNDTANPEYLLSEFTVWSDTHDYAGTGDLAFRYKGRLVLADTKTGKGVYPDVAMQLAALAFADYIVCDEGEKAQIPEFDAYGVLHVRPRSCTLVPVFHIEEWFKAFLGLRELFRVDVECKDTTLGAGAKFSA